MHTYTRPFRKEVYDKVDAPSKLALVKYLESEGHTIVSTAENYNADVVSEKDGITYFNEAERKAQWDGEWPTYWEEVRIPGRKRRLVNKYKNNIENLYFYVFNKNYDKAWKVKGTQMTDEALKEAFGTRIPDGETFYHIPYKEAELVNLA